MHAERSKRAGFRMTGIAVAPIAAAAILVSFQAIAVARGHGRAAFENLAQVALLLAVAAGLVAAYLASTLPRQPTSRVVAGLFGLAYGFMATGPLYWLLRVALETAGVQVVL